MKKIRYLAVLILSLILLIGCQNKEKLGSIIDLDESKIKKITVETTLTDTKSEVVLEKNNYKKFLDKLSSYYISEKKEDNKKGWHYLIKIESDKEILISIIDNIINVNGKSYKLDKYNNQDLLYLFSNN